MKYSEKRREAVLRKLGPPNNRSVTDVAAEEGISAPTIYAWRAQARKDGRLMPDRGTQGPEGWSSRDKSNAVLETAALSEEELAGYCRQRGLYPEQIEQWRLSCEQANDRAEATSQRHADSMKQERRRNRQLTQELRRKEEALAETAALLTLRGKANAIWGDEES